MSYARTIEPQILTIQAIIQKSEYKSKLLNNIPVDLKKLFMDQLTLSNPKTRQTKRQPTSYQNTHIQTIQYKDSQTNQTANSKIRKNKSNNLIPPLPHSNSLQIKSQSLNISKQNLKPNLSNNEVPKPATCHNQTLKTTRTYANSREGKRVKKGRRYERNSLGEGGSSIQKIRQFAEAQRGQKKMEQISKNENEHRNPEVRNQIDPLKQAERQEGNIKKFCRFQYQLVLPEKKSKNGGFHKVSERRQKKFSKLAKEPSKSIGEQILSKNYYKQQQKTEISFKTSKQPQLQKDGHHDKCSFLKQNFQQRISEDTIPDFVIATITEENRNQTVKNVASKQLQFHFDQFKQARHRIIKPPTSVVNMKKKMSYNRVRKSEQQSGQCQDVIEPKVSFIKLLQKQKQKQKQKEIKQRQNEIHQRSTQTISKEKQFRSKHKIPHFGSKKLMKANYDEQVKGWEAGWEFIEPQFDIQ